MPWQILIDGEGDGDYSRSVGKPTYPGGCVFEHDLKGAYRDFGIDSKGIFYTRLKPNQDLFEEVDKIEIPEAIRSALQNPFFFGGTIIRPGTVDFKVEIPEGRFGVETEDGKVYRDPRTPVQIARDIIMELASKGRLSRPILSYNNIAWGEENRGPENFEEREDLITFSDNKPPIVERSVVEIDADDIETTFEARVLESDRFNAPNYWADVNADYIQLNLECPDDGTEQRNISLQRVVVGSHQWTEVSEILDI